MNAMLTDHASIEMLERLGGDRFIATTGAKDFISADNPQPRLLFRVPANQTVERGTYFEVSLLPNGNYLCVFFKMKRGTSMVTRNAQERHIIDRGEYQKGDLRDAFTAMTGMEVSL